MKPELKRYPAEVDGKTITFETGQLAGQAGGAVTIRVGDTMMFCAATMSSGPREGINFFPLSVDYEERMYAGGQIPGSFFRREGRPGENAVLTSRLTDRPLRPLFPKDMRNEVQVILYSFSSDGEEIMDVLAINAASAALSISDIPWNGPIAAVRVGRIDGEFVTNPTYTELQDSELDLRVAGTREAIMMVECGAEEVPEDVMSAALDYAHKSMQPLIDAQEKMAAEVGKPKREYPSLKLGEDVITQVQERALSGMEEILAKDYNKHEQREKLDELRSETIAALVTDEGEITEKDVIEAFEAEHGKAVRKRIIEKGVRPDGRSSTDIRPIWCEVDFSPRAHGSAIFTRGETQILSVATLGTPRDAQKVDNLTPEEEKRYMHHYNFPPFSVGEVRFLRGTSRREIGHGALAERALLPVLPSEEDFPYTLRVVSECLSSNG
ncbi:MAG: polyribonucleotide nucleotidyltransferase, partial [Chloroflexi bacterium]|nr:polyribonucleotide nucleotidyltransferase [Chloroflexota bacterium]